MPVLLAIALLAQNRTVIPDGNDQNDKTRVAPPRCTQSGDEIVVCGANDPIVHRLRRIDPRYVEKPIRPMVRLPGGGEADVAAEQRGVGGVSVPSAMVRLKIPLGKGSSDPK